MKIQPEILEIIIGILGITLIPLAKFYFNNHLGNKVVLRKIKETSLLSIPEFIKEKNTFKFKDRPINKLRLYELELSNEGLIDIDTLEITLELNSQEKPNLIEIEVDDYLNKTELTDISNGEYFYLIKRPYLNMKRRNKEEKLSIQILTDVEFDLKPIGGGKGWSLSYKNSNDEKIRRIKINGWILRGTIITTLALYFEAIDFFPKVIWGGLSIIPLFLYFAMMIFLIYIMKKL